MLDEREFRHLGRTWTQKRLPWQARSSRRIRTMARNRSVSKALPMRILGRRRPGASAEAISLPLGGSVDWEIDHVPITHPEIHWVPGCGRMQDCSIETSYFLGFRETFA